MEYYWALFGKLAALAAIIFAILRLIRAKRRLKEIPHATADPPPPKEPLSEKMVAYRKAQQDKANTAQIDYDKLVITLSGGALGVSFTFLKDVAKQHALSHTNVLFGAWVCWGLSVACILASLYTGILAHRRAIRQVDAGTIYDRRPGGFLDFSTTLLNPAAGILFIFGLVFIIRFVYLNPYG
jgi:hypothetical protein